MGCVNSVEDKHAVGTSFNDHNGAASKRWETDAAAAVAEMLGPGTVSHVEISVKCHKLPDKDVFSKSDPMAVLLAADNQAGDSWTEVDRSDAVLNCLDPVFPRPLNCTYNFERLQPMRLVLYDVDDTAVDTRKLDLAKQDFLAEGKFLLSDVLTGQGQTLTVQLFNERSQLLPGCTAILSAEELPNSNAAVTLVLSASGLENKDMFSKSDPFVRISKARENGMWAPVLRTEVIPNNLNPQWQPIQASMAQLCNSDLYRPLQFEVFNSNRSGQHDFIGQVAASLHDLQQAAAAGRGLPLINPRKAGKAGYTSSGTLHIKGATVQPRPSFLDYVRGGVELNFMVAIDMTASNGDPRNPNSLHYMSPQQNVYEQAINAVGGVLEHYDTDKKFPCFGFGAIPNNGTGAASHCFALNGNANNPEVDGIKGILHAYRHALYNCRLSGPTLFHHTINVAAQAARQAEAKIVSKRPGDPMVYWILLILTDGVIMDMEHTLQALVDASQLPLSLLIVGVGNEDFTAMEVLDGDEERIRAPNGRVAARDFVQFVPFRAHQGSADSLAAELLAELPGQLVEYFNDLKRIPPPARFLPYGEG